MGIGLIVEVMDHAPEDLSSGQRLVLLVIAEWANDGTRVAIQTKTWTLDTICRRAGIQRPGLKSVLQGLAKKGLEVRVPISVKDGKPTFAYEGKSVTFKLPELAKRGGQDIPTEWGCESTPTSREGMPQHPSGVATASERGCYSHPHPLIYPSKNPSKNSQSLSPREADEPEPAGADNRERDEAIPENREYGKTRAHHVLRQRGKTGDHANRIIETIHRLVGEKKGPGWWARLHANNDIAEWIDRAERLIDGRERWPNTGSPADDRLREGMALVAKLEGRIRPDELHVFKSDPSGKVCERCYAGEDDPRHVPDNGLGRFQPTEHFDPHTQGWRPQPQEEPA